LWGIGYNSGPMSIERVARGVAEGISFIAISGAVDFKRARASGEGLAEAAFTATTIMAFCIAGSYYLNMPFMVPIFLAGFIRLNRESIKFFDWVNSKLEKKE